MAPAFAQGFVAIGCAWRIEYEGALYHVIMKSRMPHDELPHQNAGRNLVVCEDAEDMDKTLGI
jgi:hypothetical protein